MTKEFDPTDQYAQITGLELTEQQLEELGNRQAIMAERNIWPSPNKLPEDIKPQPPESH